MRGPPRSPSASAKRRSTSTKLAPAARAARSAARRASIPPSKPPKPSSPWSAAITGRPKPASSRAKRSSPPATSSAIASRRISTRSAPRWARASRARSSASMSRGTRDTTIRALVTGSPPRLASLLRGAEHLARRAGDRVVEGARPRLLLEGRAMLRDQRLVPASERTRQRLRAVQLVEVRRRAQREPAVGAAERFRVLPSLTSRSARAARSTRDTTPVATRVARAW